MQASFWVAAMTGPNVLSAKENTEREGFEPSWRVSPPTAFPESVRSLTGRVWDRLLNTNETVRPTATDWLRPPIGIGAGISLLLKPTRHSPQSLEPHGASRQRSDLALDVPYAPPLGFLSSRHLK
jgi:hypothetical protein